MFLKVMLLLQAFVNVILRICGASRNPSVTAELVQLANKCYYHIMRNSMP